MPLLQHVNAWRTAIGIGAARNLLASEERQSFFVVYAEAPLLLRIWRLPAWRIADSKTLSRIHLLSLVYNAHVLVIIFTTDEPYRAINNSISLQGDRGVFDWKRFILNPAGRANGLGRLKRFDLTT